MKDYIGRIVEFLRNNFKKNEIFCIIGMDFFLFCCQEYQIMKLCMSYA